MLSEVVENNDSRAELEHYSAKRDQLELDHYRLQEKRALCDVNYWHYMRQCKEAELNQQQEVRILKQHRKLTVIRL